LAVPELDSVNAELNSPATELISANSEPGSATAEFISVNGELDSPVAEMIPAAGEIIFHSGELSSPVPAGSSRRDDGSGVTHRAQLETLL
jgi:hypothetical protein